jgi:hypothetical protein
MMYFLNSKEVSLHIMSNTIRVSHQKTDYGCVKTLRDLISWEFIQSYQDTRAYKMLDVEVIAEYDARFVPWAGKHKNVTYWWKLANGYSVAFNENVSVGWSFPVIKTPN